MSSNQQSRRDFLKLSAASLVGSYAVTRLMTGASIAEAAAAGLLKESDPMAQALGYREDATKVDTKKWAKRAGPDGAKQFCYTCVLFQAGGKDPKTVAEGVCPAVGNKGVKAKGWCNSWAQNPAVKI